MYVYFMMRRKYARIIRWLDIGYVGAGNQPV